MKILLSSAFLITCFSLFGQSGKLAKADSYYEKLSYSYAVELYEELIGSEVDSPQLRSKLGTSYYQMGDMPSAEKHFSQMISTKDATKDDYFFYAQALKQNGKYAESDQWMQKLHEKNVADSRGISFANNASYVEKIEQQGNYFTVKNLAVNSASADFGGYPSSDSKTVYFVSSRKESIVVQKEWAWNSKRFLDLYTAEVGKDHELVQADAIAKKVNTKYHEGPLCFSSDGKTVYFTRNNISKGKKKRDQKGIQNLKLYRATIDASGKWTNEEVLPFNSTEFSVGHPTLSADGKTLYFASDMPGGFGGADLYKVELMANGAFGKPLNLGKEFNTEGQEMFPWMSNDGNLFFSSNGHIGLGGLDVFVMTVDKNGLFSQLLNAGKPLNSQNDDFAFTMNSDNRTGYFSSNRAGGKGDDDIYSYELIKPFKRILMVEGVIRDILSHEILPGSTVYLKDASGTILETATADENGKYGFNIEPDLDYQISANKEDYYDNAANLSTKNLSPDLEILSKDVDLEKDPGLALYLLVSDAKTKLPLEGVKVKVIDNQTGQEFMDFNTPITGDARKGLTDKKLNDQLSYSINIQKEGYLSKTVTFNYQITKPGIINVQEALDLSMNKLEIGIDLASLIEIKPIYFDYAKYAIRKDAAVELDKIVKVMNEYPTMQIELGSHTDCRGKISSNATLSDNRAKASATYIKARISNPSRIYGKGYGESKLKNGCECEGTVKSTCSETEHQENRRTEFVIITM